MQQASQEFFEGWCEQEAGCNRARQSVSGSERTCERLRAGVDPGQPLRRAEI